MRFDKSAKPFWALFGVAALCGCGANVDPYAPAAGGEPRTAAAPSSQSHADTPKGEAVTGRGQGTLDVSAGVAVPSYLGAIHALVRDASGAVIGGADEDVAREAVDQPRELSLILPAGDEYTLTLTATTGQNDATTCNASLGPLSIEADSAARAQVFAWSCGDVAGYVPSAIENDCYWLVDWQFVTRTSAAVGDVIGVSVAGHDAAGNPALIAWSTSPARGFFADPRASQTAFRCQARDRALPLTVALTDGKCRQQVTQTVACL